MMAPAREWPGTSTCARSPGPITVGAPLCEGARLFEMNTDVLGKSGAPNNDVALPTAPYAIRGLSAGPSAGVDTLPLRRRAKVPACSKRRPRCWKPPGCAEQPDALALRF
jgi:hypothetical protein